MRADQIAARGRVGPTCGMSLTSSGRLSRLISLGTFIRDSIQAFLNGDYGFIKIFEAVAEMDRVFTGTAEM